MTASGSGTPRGSPLDRFLRLFSDVRAGEGGTALLLALNVFILLTAYYVLKVLREPLILAGGTNIGGAELKSRASAGQALALVVLVPLYGALAGRLPRRRLINIVTAFFVGCLATFFVLARLGVPVGVPFYIWVGIFSLMIIAQFWSFANDLYTSEEGKRLFPIVAFGGSAGAVFGSWATGALFEPVGTNPLFLVVAVLLVLAAAITNYVDLSERRRTEAAVPDPMSSGQLPAATDQIRTATGEFKAPDDAYKTASGTMKALRREDLERLRAQPATPAPAPSGASAFGLVLRNQYLLLIALLMLLLNCVNTTGEYVLGRTVTAAAAAAAARGGPTAEAGISAFYSGYYAAVNLLSLGLQLFVVGRFLKFAGVRAALLVLPLIAFSGYTLMAFAPILVAMRWAKIAENATDYSLQNTVRNVLFLPTTREEKYAAKQAIDSFFVRMGDVMSAVLVFLGTSWLALGTRYFAMANMVLVLGWIVLAVLIGRRYQRLAAAVA